MNIQKKPYKIDFIGNDPKFIIRTDPYHTYGKRYSRKFAITSLSIGELSISTPHGDWVFSVTNNQDDKANSIKKSTTLSDVFAQILLKIKYNHFLTTFYDIDAVQEQTRIILSLTDKSYQAQSADITIGSSGLPSEVSVISTTQGVNRTEKEKYKLLCRFEISRNEETILTPDFYYDDNNGKVAVSTKALQAYFTEYDIPPYLEPEGIYLCPNALIDVRMLYAESINNNIGFVRQTSTVTLINGKIDRYARDNNIPDWESAYDDKFYLHTHVDIFGIDQNGKSKTDRFTEQYIYLCNFTGSTKTASISYEILTDEGPDTISGESYTVPKGISRVPATICNISDNPDGIIKYTVVISISGQNDIRRTYELVPRPFNARTMLMLNRCNLYESFVVNNIAKEDATSGNQANVSGQDLFIINDAVTKYTARTGLRTAKDIELLHDALSKDGNLLIDGQYAYNMSIAPGSFVVLDEQEDLIDVEFQYMLGKKRDRMPNIVEVIAEGTKIDMTDTLIP